MFLQEQKNSESTDISGDLTANLQIDQSLWHGVGGVNETSKQGSSKASAIAQKPDRRGGARFISDFAIALMVNGE